MEGHQERARAAQATIACAKDVLTFFVKHGNSTTFTPKNTQDFAALCRVLASAASPLPEMNPLVIDVVKSGKEHIGGVSFSFVKSAGSFL